MSFENKNLWRCEIIQSESFPYFTLLVKYATTELYGAKLK